MSRELLMVIGAGVYGVTIWGLLVAGYAVMSSAFEKDGSEAEPEAQTDHPENVRSPVPACARVTQPLVRVAKRASGLPERRSR